MGRKLRCNGFWLFIRALRRTLRHSGLKTNSGQAQADLSLPALHSVASHYWETLDPSVKSAWKMAAKEYSRTPEFRALQLKHSQRIRNDPSYAADRRRRRYQRMVKRMEEEREEECQGLDDEDLHVGVDEEDENEDGPALVALAEQMERWSDSGLGSASTSLLSIPNLATLEEDDSSVSAEGDTVTFSATPAATPPSIQTAVKSWAQVVRTGSSHS